MVRPAFSGYDYGNDITQAPGYVVIRSGDGSRNAGDEVPEHRQGRTIQDCDATNECRAGAKQIPLKYTRVPSGVKVYEPANRHVKNATALPPRFSFVSTVFVLVYGDNSVIERTRGHVGKRSVWSNADLGRCGSDRDSGGHIKVVRSNTVTVLRPSVTWRASLRPILWGCRLHSRGTERVAMSITSTAPVPGRNRFWSF